VIGDERESNVRRGTLADQLEAVLAALDVLPLETPTDATYGATRVALEEAGAPIGGNDLLIAAQVLALDLVVVTNSEREFGRVGGLEVENWLEEYLYRVRSGYCQPGKRV
jgi:tRNA(fMet)-specific endonuclease VapC